MCNYFLQQASLPEAHSITSHPLTALLSSLVLYFAFEMAAARLKMLLDLPVKQLSKRRVPSLAFYTLSLYLLSLLVWSSFSPQHPCQSP